VSHKRFNGLKLLINALNDTLFLITIINDKRQNSRKRLTLFKWS